MRTYYNDNDPHCCQVIRKNIHLGFLPEGHVDERTIQDVTWEDIALYQHVHLFAGIAGFPLGMRWAGYPLWLRTMTGGFPCTDLSVAGKRAGLQGEASGLWAEMARLIRTSAEHDIWYDYILIENVPGLLSGGHYDEETTQEAAESDAVKDGSLCPTDSGSVGDATDESVFQSWMGIILADLAQAGYDATWTVLRASDFGAPHRRERVFLVAYPDRKRSSSIRDWVSTGANDTVSPSITGDVAYATSQQDDWVQQSRVFTNARPSGTSRAYDVAYPNGDRQWNGTDQPEPRAECEGTPDACIHVSLQSLADSTEQGLQEWRHTGLNTFDTQARAGMESEPQRCSELAHADCERCQECNTSTITDGTGHIAWRTRAPGNVEDARSRREWQYQGTGGEAGEQPLAEQSSTGNIEPRVGRVSHGLPTGMDLSCWWPAGPGNEQYEWEPPRVSATGRQKHRIARLKALGNSVMPQCVMYIALCIMAYENAMVHEEIQ